MGRGTDIPVINRIAALDTIYQSVMGVERDKVCAGNPGEIMTEKSEPLTDIRVQMTGQDGNAFSILGRVCNALKRGGRNDLVDPFMKEATSGDYDHLLQTVMKYVVVY